MTGRALALVALAVAACGSGEGIRVQLALDETDCGDDSAAEITLPCAGEVGIWLLDESDMVVEETCIPLAEGVPLFSLDDFLVEQGVRFSSRAPGEQLVVEMAVFEEGSIDQCPRPSAQIDPSTSFVYGRSDLFVVDGAVEPIVTLGCFNIANQCAPAFTITAQLIEFEGLTPFDTAELLAFGVVANAEFQFLTDLFPDVDGHVGQLSRVPEGDCLAVEVPIDDNPGLPTVLSCDGEIDEPNDQAAVQAYYLSPGLRQTFANLVSPMTTMVVGRVLNPDGTPAENAGIDAGGRLVGYPDEALNSFAGSSTASHGYFVIHGPETECCYEVTATGQPDPFPTIGRRRTGTVIGHMTTTLIELKL